MTRKRKDYRELKVSSFSGYGYKSAPMLRIQGLWLEMGSEKMLSDILETLRDSYDYILIDTSPSLGALTINAMSAADEVLMYSVSSSFQLQMNKV